MLCALPTGRAKGHSEDERTPARPSSPCLEASVCLCIFSPAYTYYTYVLRANPEPVLLGYTALYTYMLHLYIQLNSAPSSSAARMH